MMFFNEFEFDFVVWVKVGKFIFDLVISYMIYSKIYKYIIYEVWV